MVPRFDHQVGDESTRYLVPSTCRSCLNPECMVNCPVGSIHRGDNGEIVIEDWCIGCQRCALYCPYGAIQMHDTGLVPRSAFGWRYAAGLRRGRGDSVAAAGVRRPLLGDRPDAVLLQPGFSGHARHFGCHQSRNAESLFSLHVHRPCRAAGRHGFPVTNQVAGARKSKRG